MSYPFVNKLVYSFDVYPSTIIGNDFKNVTVLGIVGYEQAIRDADIPAIHANVYPLLPQGTPEDPTQYDYLLVRTSAGRNTVLGIPWINLETVQLVESRKMSIVLDGVGSVDVDRVRSILVANGYNNISISLN